jgi:hypothetical protein
MPRLPAAPPGWLLTELGPTLALATVLAGSTRGASDLVADALARDRSWSTVEDGTDPTPRLRTAVVRTFLDSPLGRSRPPGSATGLDALTGVTRTAVTLRDLERLNTGEIATIMDRPGKGIAQQLASVPAGYHDAEIAELRTLAPSAGQVSDGFARASRAVRRSRRRRTGLLAALALAVVAAVALPNLVLSHLPVEVRRAGEWRYSHEVKLATGWKLMSRSIDPEAETTIVQVPSGADDPADCTVLVRVASVLPDIPGSRVDAATVRGRPAKLATRPGNTVNVYWEYAPGAWASVECDSRVPVRRETMVGIAEAVRFRDVRQALPFTLTALPEGYRIRTVGETFAPLYGDVVWGPTVLLEPPADSYWAAILVGPDLAELAGVSSQTIVSCLDPDRSLCVSAFQMDDQVAPNRGMSRRAVATTLANLRAAADPSDRATWFDASTLPG